jgi:hypothetical protein
VRNTFIIACCSKKLDQKAKAKDLYISNLFKASRRLAESYPSSEWWVVSAKYGLVHPDQAIEPYDLSLGSMVKKDRERWGVYTRREMVRRIKNPSQIVLLCGEDYTRQIIDGAKVLTKKVYVPLKGLALGEKVKWLTAKAKSNKGSK